MSANHRSLPETEAGRQMTATSKAIQLGMRDSYAVYAGLWGYMSEQLAGDLDHEADFNGWACYCVGIRNSMFRVGLCMLSALIFWVSWLGKRGIDFFPEHEPRFRGDHCSCHSFCKNSRRSAPNKCCRTGFPGLQECTIYRTQHVRGKASSRHAGPSRSDRPVPMMYCNKHHLRSRLHC